MTVSFSPKVVHVLLRYGLATLALSYLAVSTYTRPTPTNSTITKEVAKDSSIELDCSPQNPTNNDGSLLSSVTQDYEVNPCLFASC